VACQRSAFNISAGVADLNFEAPNASRTPWEWKAVRPQFHPRKKLEKTDLPTLIKAQLSQFLLSSSSQEWGGQSPPTQKVGGTMSPLPPLMRRPWTSSLSFNASEDIYLPNHTCKYFGNHLVDLSQVVVPPRQNKKNPKRYLMLVKRKNTSITSGRLNLSGSTYEWLK